MVSQFSGWITFFCVIPSDPIKIIKNLKYGLIPQPSPPPSPPPSLAVKICFLLNIWMKEKLKICLWENLGRMKKKHIMASLGILYRFLPHLDTADFI